MLVTVPREEFASSRFHYKAGQHVVFAGPTQRAGKTTLAFKLLEYVATPSLPAYVAVCKPKDKVSSSEGERLGFRRVEEWPVSPRVRELWDGKPSGYLVWPKFGDMDTDVERCSVVTAKLLGNIYTNGVKNKHAILMLDDTVVKSKVLGLDREMVTIITMSGAMGIGGWFFVQKPTDAGRTALWAYPNAEHVFISKDPEARNRVRYNEIGGFDSNVVYAAQNQLKPYEFLYLERTHGYMCIVGAK
jgi:hypothetical protein